ncbi:MAG: SRPBCC family protein [Gammaproteobacteria bacterium]|nr:SRPBCC family protein [Gammaproteobacteria bacterium]
MRKNLLAGTSVIVTLLVTCALQAATIERTELRFRGRTYHYLFSAHLSANPEAVRAVVSDIERLARLNDNIITSQVLARESPTKIKRRLLLKHCILVFCFDIDFVETLEVLPSGDIATRIIPGAGNFERGETIWRIEAISDTATRVTMEADQEPKFWIPPLIGPLLIKRSFINEVTETLQNLERIANAPLQ